MNNTLAHNRKQLNFFLTADCDNYKQEWASQAFIHLEWAIPVTQTRTGEALRWLDSSNGGGNSVKLRLTELNPSSSKDFSDNR